MAHFTQLNLQGNSGTKQAQTPSSAGAKTPLAGKPPKKPHGTAKTLAIAGSLVVAALVTTLTIGTNGCSKSNKQAIAAPSVPMTPMTQTAAAPAPIVAEPVAATVVPKPVKKTSRQHSFTTYKNADYGISFRYPRSYKVMKSEKAIVELAGLGEMNFVQPGGTTLAAVQLPDRMFPGTNFASAFFTVAVNPKLTAKECEQFAFENAKHTATADDADHASPTEPTKVKMGAAEYTEVESMGGESTKQADAKYYHVLQNGACYEFALGMATKEGKADLKPVDSNAVFHKLNWMLSTVKITAAGVPAKTEPALAATPATTPLPTLDNTATAPAPVTTSAVVEGGKN